MAKKITTKNPSNSVMTVNQAMMKRFTYHYTNMTKLWGVERHSSFDPSHYPLKTLINVMELCEVFSSRENHIPFKVTCPYGRKPQFAASGSQLLYAIGNSVKALANAGYLTIIEGGGKKHIRKTYVNVDDPNDLLTVDKNVVVPYLYNTIDGFPYAEVANEIRKYINKALND